MASTMPDLPSAKHHCPFAGTKFYCLATGHKGVNSLSGVVMQPHSNRELNWRPVDRKSDAQPVATSCRHHAHRKQKYYYHLMHGVVSLGRGFAVYKCFTEIPYRLNTLFYSMSHIMY